MNGIGHNIEGAGLDALQRIANEANALLGEGIENTFMFGRFLFDKKRELGHGSFKRLFANHPDPLPEPIRCSHRQANKYMSIAGNEELQKAPHAALLPPSSEVLYELSRLDKSDLITAFGANLINPFIQRKDVKRIRIAIGLDDEPVPKQKKTKTPTEFIETVDQSLIDIGTHLDEDEAEDFFLRLKETIHHAENRVMALIEINSKKEHA